MSSNTIGWLDRLTRAIDREYERRIRAASEVIEYGMGHGHGHNHHDDHSDAHAHAGESRTKDHHEDDDDGSVIMNVPPGTRFGGAGNRGRPPSQED